VRLKKLVAERELEIELTKEAAAMKWSARAGVVDRKYDGSNIEPAYAGCTSASCKSRICSITEQFVSNLPSRWVH
jgi:hypothetical protein